MTHDEDATHNINTFVSSNPNLGALRTEIDADDAHVCWRMGGRKRIKERMARIWDEPE